MVSCNEELGLLVFISGTCPSNWERDAIQSVQCAVEEDRDPFRIEKNKKKEREERERMRTLISFGQYKNRVHGGIEGRRRVRERKKGRREKKGWMDATTVGCVVS